MKRAPRDPEPVKRWRTFLENHKEAIAAMDFFTVPTITFGVLYCFFVIGHDRRRILHFNITKHPTSSWIIQQLREAFPFGGAPGFLIHDRDAKYGTEVPAAIRSLQIDAVRTSFESPWQNGVAERWVGSCRRELLDHVIALNERHLKRLLAEYVSYHHEDRTHLGLGKETPGCRTRCVTSGRVLSHDRLGAEIVRFGFAVLCFAHRAFCARLILRRADADIVRDAPFELMLPSAASAASMRWTSLPRTIASSIWCF